MTPFEIAHSYIGITEGPGPADNPVIIEMYSSVGQDWVEHDSVAWCAAFVGHCMERAGLRSTRKLNARSYLGWGVPVDIDDALPGDVVILSRGDPSGWQGHVGFFVRSTGPSIDILGGNQGDAVSIRRFSKTRLLGIRRAGNVAFASGMTVREVQKTLRLLGYSEVGDVDGIIGPRTKAAILAFRSDNNLPLVPIIDVALVDGIRSAKPRAISEARATGKPIGSRIVSASNAQIGLGVVGAAGTVASQIAPAIAEAENARSLADRFLAMTGLDTWLAGALPWVGAAVFALVIIYAIKAKSARIADHQSGRTM